MQIKLYALFIFMMMILVACQEVLYDSSQTESWEHAVTMPGRAENLFAGYDIDGNERSCEDLDDMFCSDEFTESDQYALDCQRGGNVAIQCSCHDWICVDKQTLEHEDESVEITGYDIDGNIDSCKPFDYRVDGQQVACTMVFTEEDQFAIDCQAEGHEVVQCGCHKYLCLM